MDLQLNIDSLDICNNLPAYGPILRDNKIWEAKELWWINQYGCCLSILCRAKSAVLKEERCKCFNHSCFLLFKICFIITMIFLIIFQIMTVIVNYEPNYAQNITFISIEVLIIFILLFWWQLCGMLCPAYKQVDTKSCGNYKVIQQPLEVEIWICRGCMENYDKRQKFLQILDSRISEEQKMFLLNTDTIIQQSSNLQENEVQTQINRSPIPRLPRENLNDTEFSIAQIQEQNDIYIKIQNSIDNILDLTRVSSRKNQLIILTKFHLKEYFGTYAEICKGTVLGSGGFGKVYNIQNKKDLKQYAIKVIITSEKEDYDSAMTEVQIINKLNFHQNLMYNEFLCVYSEQNMQLSQLFFFIIIAMPLAEYSLETEILNLKEQGEQQMSFNKFKQIALDCAQGLFYLQSNNIYHLDIKPENILFMHGNYLISDFGMSRMITQPKFSTSIKGGTPIYMSPQAYKLWQGDRTSKPDWEKCDTWSLGLVLLVVYKQISKKEFYNLGNNQATLRNLIADIENESVKYILNHLLEEDQEKRWGCKQLIIELNDL